MAIRVSEYKSLNTGIIVRDLWQNPIDYSLIPYYYLRESERG